MNLDEKMTSIDERLVGSLDKNFDLHCKQSECSKAVILNFLVAS